MKENTEPVVFIDSDSNYCTFILWDRHGLFLTFHPEKPKLACESKPSSFHCIRNNLAFAELSGKVTVVDLETRLSIEVCSAEHGLKNIDNLRITILAKNKKSQLILFDYKEKMCVSCDFNLESVLGLGFSITEVCKFEVDSSETVQLMTLLNDNIVIVTENFIYREKRRCDVEGCYIGKEFGIGPSWPEYDSLKQSWQHISRQPSSTYEHQFCRFR